MAWQGRQADLGERADRSPVPVPQSTRRLRRTSASKNWRRWPAYREVGATPHTYLVARRVSRAKELLAGASPLSEVALACGFYDQSHFTRIFKAWSGVTPGQYRRGSNLIQDKAA